MKRMAVILSVVYAVVATADDYFVDDVYFSPQSQLLQQLSRPENITPYYNRNAKEIIFIEDSSGTQSPDTVRAIIRDVR